MSEVEINPVKLHQELLSVDLPVVSVSTDGRIDYSRDLTVSEQSTAAAVIAAHNVSQTTEESCMQAYFDAGISVQSMAFALWKKIMQADSTDADEIQSLMDAINATIN
jgi:hypothetical protein